MLIVSGYFLNFLKITTSLFIKFVAVFAGGGGGGGGAAAAAAAALI